MVSEIMAETFTLHDVHIWERVYVAFLLQKKVKKKQQQSMTHESIQEFNFHINISHFWHIHALRFYRPTFFRRRLQKWACIYGLYVRSPLSYKIMAVIKVLRNVKHKFLPSFNKIFAYEALIPWNLSAEPLSLFFFERKEKWCRAWLYLLFGICSREREWEMINRFRVQIGTFVASENVVHNWTSHWILPNNNSLIAVAIECGNSAAANSNS